jgi:hypothetical protein
MADSAVPRLVNYAGVAKDENGKAMKGVIGATFAVYAEQDGGSPLWMETQNINANSNGTFSVQLGATKPGGLPVDLFSAGQARWLGVNYDGGAEQPRIALLSVPYALKAGDAQTLGGLPASAFMLAAPSSSSPSATPATLASTEAALSPAGGVTGSGTLDFIPLWTSTSAIGNSVLFQSGSGSTAKVGINTTTPGATLDVKGTTNLEGLLTLPAQGTATASGGKGSQPQDLVASAFSSSTKAAVHQTFQWKAEASGNNTATPSGTLNLLFGSGTASPSETGLKLSSKGLFTFAAGQTFPGTGTLTGVTTASGSGLTGGGASGTLTLGLTTSCSKNQLLQWNGSTWACSSAGTGSGTATSVGLAAPATDFTVSGSPVTGAGTLRFAWNVAPTNADTANAIVKRDATGSFNATSITGIGTFSTTTANANAITGSTSLDGGSAIVGSATATGGSNRTYGVTGNSVSSVAGSTGVLGLDGNTNALLTGGFTIGVQGASSNQVNGIGVFGFDGTSLSSLFNNIEQGVGVWGDGGSSRGVAVAGTVDDGLAGYFMNNSPSGFDTLLVAASNENSLAFAAGGRGLCVVDYSGNLSCTGSKNAVVPIDGGKRIVAMSAIEAPQNWFEDAGEAGLVNGAAVVQLDSTYTQTVNTETEYQVFLTPYGDCKGLYVTNRTASSFEVHEVGAGTASLSFGYRIMALRKNYENVRFADHTHDLDGHKRMTGRMKARAAHPQSHDPVKNPGLSPALSPATAQLAAPSQESTH